MWLEALEPVGHWELVLIAGGADATLLRPNSRFNLLAKVALGGKDGRTNVSYGGEAGRT